MNGFNFNSNSILSPVFYKAFSVDAAIGVIPINNMVSQKDIAFALGATHFGISSGMAYIDFVNCVSNLQLTNEGILPIDLILNAVVLAPAVVP